MSDIFDFNKGFNGEAIASKTSRPIIAISSPIEGESSCLHRAYTQAIEAAGGVPLIIPYTAGLETMRAMIESVHGVLFSGGGDFDARYYGGVNIEGLTSYNSERDYHELMLLRLALDRAIPLLGICRGFQLFNIALGGDIYDDLPTQYPTEPLNHSVGGAREVGVHSITIAEGSRLRSILGTSTLEVNSRHHQAIRRVAPTLNVVATAPDGVVEAVEGYPHNKILGVQFHPENMATDGNAAPMQRLFEFFVGEAQLRKRSLEIARRYPIVDSHCDTPMLYESGGFCLAERNAQARVDIAKMEEGHLDATLTVAYIAQSTPAELATSKAVEILCRFRADLEQQSDRVVVADSVEEVLAAKACGKRAVMLALENGNAIGDDVSNVEMFRQLGVHYITLCHNGSNAICDSAKGEPLYGGVSRFGREVIAQMNRLGITVDVSHSSELSTLQALEISERPIIASHSSCRALCDHPRNLSDSVIKAIAARGGVVQICAYEGFLSLEGDASIETLVDHIEHAVELVGYSSVGVGSDFDGGGGVAGFEGANHYLSLIGELVRRGHKAEDIAKIMGGNILRVLSQNRQNI